MAVVAPPTSPHSERSHVSTVAGAPLRSPWLRSTLPRAAPAALAAAHRSRAVHTLQLPRPPPRSVGSGQSRRRRRRRRSRQAEARLVVAEGSRRVGRWGDRRRAVVAVAAANLRASRPVLRRVRWRASTPGDRHRCGAPCPLTRTLKPRQVPRRRRRHHRCRLARRTRHLRHRRRRRRSNHLQSRLRHSRHIHRRRRRPLHRTRTRRHDLLLCRPRRPVPRHPVRHHPSRPTRSATPAQTSPTTAGT
mmetsp:Transcript_8172/g.21046  ORF Transcript_8172/g.21046 Transcript_8172/m.21046 type:complete len:247 (-) Transcript_8172:401-1141(-)